MTTIINTPSSTDDTNSSVGWMLAFVILAVVIGVAYFWFYTRTPATSVTSGTNTTVSVPLTQPPTVAPVPIAK